VWVNQDTYEGDYVENKRNGWGKITWGFDGKEWYEGRKNFFLFGEKIIFFFFEGEWVNDKKHGKGIYFFIFFSFSFFFPDRDLSVG
jgi:radial spoke head protein 1